MASPTSTKASQIGWMFVPQYYTFVNKDPARLHCFYTKRSTLIHGVEGEDSQPCYGQQEVHEKIMSLGFEDCKVFVSTVDSQSSAEGGIIIQVVGELSNKGGPWRKFAQTFFLAEQPNGYFVLNDIFRYIKEESDDDEAVNADAASAAPAASPAAGTATSGQQEVTYDQLANAAIVGGQQQSQNAAPTHDFELAQQHGHPAEAAGVTVAPPTDSQQQESRSSLEGLVNGQTEQPVVELHDDLADSSTASVQQQQEASAPAEQVNGDHSEEAATADIVPTEVEAPSSAADPASAIAEQIQNKPEQQSTEAAPSTSASAAPAQTPAAPAAAPVQETSKPSGPKTWASLAATAGGQWRGNVASKATGVSSAAASSAGASRSATPAQKPESSTAGGASGASNAGSAPREQRAQQGSRNAETRTPNFTNVETDYSIIVTNITENISHGLLRQRLSDEFAQQHGNKREWAKLSYLDIDRQKSIAYVDFEKEWALKKAVEKGSCTIDGTTVNIAAGKGNRRDASGLGTSRPSQSLGGAGGAPSQGGPKGRGDGQRQGQGQGRGGGPGAGRGGQQRPQRGGKAGGDKQ